MVSCCSCIWLLQLLLLQLYMVICCSWIRLLQLQMAAAAAAAGLSELQQRPHRFSCCCCCCGCCGLESLARNWRAFFFRCIGGPPGGPPFVMFFLLISIPKGSRLRAILCTSALAGLQPGVSRRSNKRRLYQQIYYDDKTAYITE